MVRAAGERQLKINKGTMVLLVCYRYSRESLPAVLSWVTSDFPHPPMVLNLHVFALDLPAALHNHLTHFHSLASNSAWGKNKNNSMVNVFLYMISFVQIP